MIAGARTEQETGKKKQKWQSEGLLFLKPGFSGLRQHFRARVTFKGGFFGMVALTVGLT